MRQPTAARPRSRAAHCIGVFTVLAACATVAGCADPGEEPHDLASTPGTEDLVSASGAAVETTRAALTPTSSAAPRVVYLAYADGNSIQKMQPDPCTGIAPKFVCSFAPTLKECQEQVQAYLDRWYADFNIVFTLTRPTSGWYYMEVVSTGGGSWCGASDRVAGIAPFLCNDLQGGVAYTFSGGRTAKETAIIIAQEQAHLVGLEHTLSESDIMDPTICSDCDGFEKVDNQIQSDHCGRASQNSYEMMKDRLDEWTGGVKPTPFGCDADVSAPSVQILSPANDTVVGENFPLTVSATDDCRVAKVSVQVMPMGLATQSAVPPFDWTLTRITGRQTITVTATDPSGKVSSTSITVEAPGGATGAGGSSGGDPVAQANGPDLGAGCNLAGCDVGAAGSSATLSSVLAALAALAAILAATRRRVPARARRLARASRTPRASQSSASQQRR